MPNDPAHWMARAAPPCAFSLLTTDHYLEDSVVCLSVGEYLWPLSKAGPRMGLATAACQRSHELCASPDIFIVEFRDLSPKLTGWPSGP